VRKQLHRTRAESPSDSIVLVLCVAKRWIMKIQSSLQPGRGELRTGRREDSAVICTTACTPSLTRGGLQGFTAASLSGLLDRKTAAQAACEKKKKRAASPPACSFLIVDYDKNLRIRAIGRQSTNNMTQGYFLPTPKTFSEASAVRPLVERRAQCSWFENFEYIRETPTTIWEGTKDF
jgi:hypothetical protein